MHTKRLVVREVESQSLGDRTFTGTDRIRSRWSGKVVGYDSYTGKFYQRQEKVVLDMANALKGGIIVTRVTIDDFDSNRFDGRILKGTGKYAGIEGTLEGRTSNDPDKMYVTLRYHL